jgi:hypothetical protein
MTTQNPLINGETAESIQTRIDALQSALDVTAPDFAKSAAEYVSLVEHHRNILRVENTGALNKAKAQLGDIIKGALESLNVAELIGDNVTRVIYTLTPAVDATGDTPAAEEKLVVTVNPSGPTRKGAKKSNGGKNQDLQGKFDSVATPDEVEELAQIAAANADDPKALNSRTYAYKKRITDKYADAQGVDPNDTASWAKLTGFTP